MFDYYLYREAIIANFPRSEKPSKVKLDVVSLFEQSMESSLLDSRPENFYFKHSHIQLGTPVQTYTTLERLETERDKENVKNNIPYQDRISVKNETLSDVMEFMITFSEKEGYNKNIREEYTSYILGEIEKSGWSVEKKKSLARYFNFDGREINFGESSPTKQATENVEANPEGLILQGQSNRDCGEKKPKNYNPDQFTFDI